jgi:hypothetical protein
MRKSKIESRSVASRHKILDKARLDDSFRAVGVSEHAAHGRCSEIQRACCLEIKIARRDLAD